ncbi:MAG: class I SAM-dependent rRNA methyltransferase [Alphaproteobacteria bacterium]|nr:class I SAM-dependent rRNA methyltransferase [Alphaproteobacteria bacterium]MBU0798349.1 class I SAM-dependent rRNA methyltransferase [Alphaproteobacteria bacterium]MBU0887450.1 class I SAM-dependent rRNA methyltransferase [Alphaproteobacteria bacterium]MBU1813341.1 class I SAM-dependent rRNA methyltransferase [Alphaproteobacteria bacterium]
MHPTITLTTGRDNRLRGGHPWLYANEIQMTPALKELPPGSLVTLADARGDKLGTAFFNPKPLIVARLLDPRPNLAIDAGFLRDRLAAALALRDRLFDAPYYRLVHAEADRLPGLVIDRFGDALTVQMNSAGMDRLEAPLIEALTDLLHPARIILRNDSHARTLEGLDTHVRAALGGEGPIELVENGTRFRCDPLGGQKTGWFYDQRDNRAFVARMAQGKRLIDVYAYIGGFGIEAAMAGAAEVTLVDRSAPAMELAAQTAALNGVGERVTCTVGDAFQELEQRASAKEVFDVVVCDPPAFVKSKKDLAGGLRAYQKMARLAAPLVAPGGILFAASCSHNAPEEEFAKQIGIGLSKAGRSGRILRQAGAGPDHPVHPFLRESAYLKSLTLQLD